MDFIERLLGVSPDNGSGAAEFAVFAVLMLAPLLLAVFRKRRRSLRFRS